MKKRTKKAKLENAKEIIETFNQIQNRLKKQTPSGEPKTPLDDHLIKMIKKKLKETLEDLEK